MTKIVYYVVLNKIFMKTQTINIDFLDTTIREVPSEKELSPGQVFFESLWIYPEPTNFFERTLRFFLGFGPQQGFAVDYASAAKHTAVVKLLIATISKNRDSLVRVELNWQEAGYDHGKFRHFLALALYLNLIRIHSTRYGLRVALCFEFELDP